MYSFCWYQTPDTIENNSYSIKTTTETRSKDVHVVEFQVRLPIMWYNVHFQNRNPLFPCSLKKHNINMSSDIKSWIFAVMIF